MKRIVSILIVGLAAMAWGGEGYGQFTTSTIDATFDGAGIYPNNLTSGTTTWYLTWNNTDLFVFIQNANETEPVSIFLDVDPVVPVNGGTNTDGTLNGLNYDGYTTAPNLPFRADILIYAHNGYREIFRRNGSGGWTSLGGGGDGICGGGTSDYTGNANGQYASNNNGNGAGGDDRREFRISWSRLLGTINGGARPASFNWMGYISYNNGMYAQAPTENYNGNQVSTNSIGIVRYFTVSSTENGSSTNPFSRNSYTHPIGASNGSFGAINVWDFTMNSPSQSITRTSGTGQAWVISNNLVINDGTISFGTSTTTATVGSLVQSGGTFTLSGSGGGDLNVGVNFTKTGGTFNCNNRAVTFNGTAKQVFSSTSTENINFLIVSNITDSVVLTSDVNIPAPTVSATTLNLSNGARLQVRPSKNLFVNSSGNILGNINLGGTNTRLHILGTLRNSGTSNANTYTNVSTTTLVFGNESTYEHNFTTGAGTIPTADWQTGSTCEIIGYTTFAGSANNSFNQTFSNFIWNCPNQSANTNIQLNNITPPTIQGTLSILNTGGNFLRFASAGTYTLNVNNLYISSINGNARLNTANNATATINLSGNLILEQPTNTAGLEHTSAGSTSINFIGTVNQSITCETSSVVVGPINFRVNKTAGALNVDLGSSLPINANATFFRTQGTITGTIAYNQTASTLAYDGGSMTTTDIEWPTTGSGPTGVTINTTLNTSEISLHDARTLSSVLTLNNGLLLTGNYDLTISNTAVAAVIWVGDANSYVVQNGTGQLKRALLSGATDRIYSFPVGDAQGLAHLIYYSDANSLAGRILGVRTISGISPNMNTPNTPPDYITRYWVTTLDNTSGTYSYRFDALAYQSPAQVVGTEANINVSYFNGTGWVDATTTSQNPLISGSLYNQTTAPLNTGHFSGRNSSALYTWTGVTSNSWDETTNWSPAGFPSATDRILVDNSSTNPLVISDAKTISTATFEGTGVVTVTGTGSLQATTFTLQGTAILNLQSGSGLTLTGTGITYENTATANFDCNSTVNYFGTGAQTIMPVQYGHLNVSGGLRTFVSGASTKICGDYTRSGTGTTLTGSTIEYNGSSVQDIKIHSAAYETLIISNTSGDYCTVETSGALVVNTAMTINAGSKLNTLTRNVTLGSSMSTVNGTWRAGGGAVSGLITSTTSNLSFGATGVYEHNFTNTEGRVPTATWHPNSNVVVMGFTTGATLTGSGGWGQSFGNFQWNCPNQTGNLNFFGNLTTIMGNFEVTSTGTVFLAYTNVGSPVLTIGGNFIQSGGTFNINNSTGTPVIRVAGSFSQNAGSLTRTSGSSLSIIEFNGASNQLITIPNPANITNQVTFRVNNSAGVTIANGSTLPVNGGTSLQITQGNVTLAGTASITYGNSPSLAVLEYNPSGSTAITTKDEWPLTGMRRVRINSTSSQPVTLNASREMGSNSLDIIDFDNGRLALGNYNLLLTNNATGAVTVTNGYAETNGSGQLIRTILSSNNNTYVFPVGSSTAYTPLSLNFATNSLAGRQVGVRAATGTHPNMAEAPAPADYLANRYWVTTLSDAGGTYSYTPTFTYAGGDMVGTIGNVRLSRWNGSSWTNTNSSSASGVTLAASVTLTQNNGNLANGQWSGRAVKVPVTYTWSAGSSGLWTQAANWNPAGVPGSEDTVQFTHPGNYEVSNIPVNINPARMYVTNGGTTTLLPGSTGTLRLGTGSNQALQVDNGSSLVISGNLASDWYIASGSTGSVSGTVVLRGVSSNTAHTLQAESASGLTFQSGGRFEAGVLNTTHFSGNPFGDAVSGSVVFANGSVYEQFDGGNPFGANNVCVFQTGSLFRFSDNNANSIAVPSLSGRTYANFDYNSTQTKEVIGTSAFAINNLTVSQGTFQVNLTGTPGYAIRGNITVTGGATLQFNPASSGTILLNGTAQQNISGGGIFSTGSNSTVNVTNTVGVHVQKNITIDGTLSVASSGVMVVDGENYVYGAGTTLINAGTTIGIGSANGISALTDDGNIRTATRTYHAGANFVYRGTSNQVTGIGLPATITGSLQVANTGGSGNNTLTLTTIPTTTANLTLTSGLFATGSASNQLNIATGGTVNGNGGDFVTGATAGILNFQGSGSFSGSCNPYNVYASGGVNFGTGTVTIQDGGRLRINAGGFVNTNAPFYATGSTLEYNNGGNFNAATEWYANTASGRGVPYHVTIGRSGVNNTLLNFDISNAYRQCLGDITIGDAGGSGYGLILGTNSGGDIRVAGNWLRYANASFTTNNRAVFFTGNGNTQTITRNGGGTETFAYFIVNKAAGDVQLTGAPNATNVVVNGSAGGNNLQLLNGDIDLNGRTFEWGGTGNLQTDGGLRHIYSASPATFLVTGGNRAVQPTNGGTLEFNDQTTVSISAGLDFATNTTTINATLQINGGGFANLNAPVYGPNGILVYNNNGEYLRRVEWNGTEGGPGYPNDVIIQNNTFLKAGGSSGEAINNPFGARRNVIIQSGSTLSMNTETNTQAMVQDLVVGQDLTIHGTLTASSNTGSDIFVGRNWYRSGTFTPNNRAVFFNTNQDGTIDNSSGTESFPYVIVDKDGSVDNTLTLLAPVNITTKFTLSSGRVISNATDVLSVTNAEPDDATNGVDYPDDGTGYVDGPMRRNVRVLGAGEEDDSYLFPLGDSVTSGHHFKRLRMKNIGVANNTFSAEFFKTRPPGAFDGSDFFGDDLIGILGNEYWEVTKEIAGNATTARLVVAYVNPGNGGWLNIFNDPIQPPLTPNINVAMVHSPDLSNWEYAGDGTGFADSTLIEPEARPYLSDGDLKTRVVSKFSPFSIGFGYASILPVRLLGFTAALHGPDGLLHWTFADAKDLRHIEIEHSTDGRQFMRLALLAPNGGADYQYRHSDLAAGAHYYRLKMVEKDGRSSYSRVEMLLVNTNRTLITGLLQNPVQGGQAILKMYSASNQEAEARLLDLSGRLLLRQKFTLLQGYNQPFISLMPLPAGMYKMLIQTNDGMEKVLTVIK